ncbi:response regulator [Geobacter hydrogenophilus]|uniref:histidine kinase n=1 Tax=Geobacter hydrogenophilus TaxID=40983 RepID=A0A9W6LD48_9BACT|nr:response regulator [Geobacter hydrogenophilus]MBT0894441.1 response regulator [Geobacter hydrogenophilus]GLI39403.1 hypothetical protein GHYDROH2_29040 [Geobacter hydrogenophilus]
MATDSVERGISLLYVEDEPDTREMFSAIIARRYPELRILVAEDGESGFVAFRQNLPQIVVTDINMPVTDGLKMATEIKSLRPHTEIIALTAYANTQQLMRAIEIGISHYILKPIDIHQIFAVLDKVLSIVRAEQEIARQNELIRSLNDDLARKAADLEMANSELEAFNYTVAHDLRSPMVSISGFAQVLLEMHAAALNDEGKKCLRIIHREVLRMSNLIGVLLKFSLYSRKRVEKSWSDLSGMANEIKNSLLQQQPGCRVVFSIAEGVKGFCDPELLRIVLENLFGNALKYSMKKEDAHIEFGMINKEDDLIYFVRDNGIGFDQQDADKLFIPFQRLESDREIAGFGIGLATASRIIQRHGGKIWAEGEKGMGATFYFSL